MERVGWGVLPTFEKPSHHGRRVLVAVERATERARERRPAGLEVAFDRCQGAIHHLGAVLERQILEEAEFEHLLLPKQAPALAAIARRHGASTSQIALAWLLARSPVILPIPGTRSIEHLEENWEARRIALSPEEMAALAT